MKGISFTGFAVCLCALAYAPARATVTPEQAVTAIEAFNKAYWNPAIKLFVKKDGSTTKDILDFWLSAHAWETIMDAYLLTKKPEYLKQIGDVYDGFIAKNKADWNNTNKYNDDIAWWIIACARAYRITGEQRYLTQAKTQFDWVYSTQRDPVLGGIWWKNDVHNSKNSCVVQPMIISALNLAKHLKDDSYRAKAEELYAWQKKTLVNPNAPGQIYDSWNADGKLGTGATTYNQGTFIGSAVGLGHYADAKVCAEWTKKNMCTATGILKESKQGDFAAFKLILVRYVMEYARLPGSGGAEFEAWMDANAGSVWSKRRVPDNIMGPDWSKDVGSTVVESATAASGVTLLTLLATPVGTPIRMQAKTVRSAGPILVFPGSKGFSGASMPSARFQDALRAMNGRILD